MTTDTTAARDQRAREVLIAHAKSLGYPRCAEAMQKMDDPFFERVTLTAMLAFASEVAGQPARRGDQATTFKRGDRVEKIGGSSWCGKIVGEYSTSLTLEGYAVESEREPGSVQIYPAKALRLVALPSSPASQPVELMHSTPTELEAWSSSRVDALADMADYLAHEAAALGVSPVEGLTSGEGRAVTRMEVIREWVGGERYARDYEYCDANFHAQADRVLALFAATPAIRQDEQRFYDAVKRYSYPAGTDVAVRIHETGWDVYDPATCPPSSFAIRQDEPEGAGVAIPDGWALVPVEPTEAMLVAAQEEWMCVRAAEDRGGVIWSAMLAASPRPAATDQAGEVERG